MSFSFFLAAAMAEQVRMLRWAFLRVEIELFETKDRLVLLQRGQLMFQDTVEASSTRIRRFVFACFTIKKARFMVLDTA